jgi:hypothetical protein
MVLHHLFDQSLLGKLTKSFSVCMLGLPSKVSHGRLVEDNAEITRVLGEVH